jgi:hypothetical protein
LLLGQRQVISSVPGYLVFRLIVTYFALETLLTLKLKPLDISIEDEFDAESRLFLDTSLSTPVLEPSQV